MKLNWEGGGGGGQGSEKQKQKHSIREIWIFSGTTHPFKISLIIFLLSVVIMCVASSLLVYWVTRILETESGTDTSTPAKVKFDISFFLVVAAGASSVMATGLSLLMHCYLHRVRERTRSEEELSLDLMYSMLPADSFSDIPPPAYSP